MAIARALVGEPKLILADEPTGNLDSKRSLQTVELLREIAHEQGASVLLVTHDRDAAGSPTATTRCATAGCWRRTTVTSRL